MKLSIVIPAYNAASTIAIQLEALAIQQWEEPWEVIVSDNGSTDNTLEIVNRFKDKLPQLKIVDSSERRGPAHARNKGVAAASGEAILFCDADDEVAPGWIAAMREALKVKDFVAGRLEYEKLNEHWTLGQQSMQTSGLQVHYPPFFPQAATSNLGIKRSLHEAVNGFDESLMRLQDAEYCWRVQLKGTKLHFIPDAVVHYRLRGTLTEVYRQVKKYSEYDILIYKRYLPLGMPRLTWKDNVSAIYLWMILLKDFLKIRKKKDLMNCVCRLGCRTGRLLGSIKQGIWAL